MTALDGWGSPDPTPPNNGTTEPCTDPTCEDCTKVLAVTEAGGRMLCRQVQVEWDTLTEHERGHYRTIAGEVFAAMSEALRETGIVRVKEPVS